MDEFVTVARVVKPQGRRGEVIAEILTDFPERFAERKRLFAAGKDGRRELQVEDHWFHKGRVVFKFKGVESITDAETLSGSELQIPLSERAAPEESAVFENELLGCTVFDRGNEIGTVEEIQRGAGDAPTLVVKRGRHEVLIPFVESFIDRLAKGRLEMKLPEGLLEVDAPLTDEEKRAQRGDDEV